MKLKIAGLLLFSHGSGLAAVGTPEWNADTVRANAYKHQIYESNYQSKMCSDDFFVVNTQTDKKSFTPDRKPYSLADKNTEASIKMKYSAYCYSKEKYEKAIDDKANNRISADAADREIAKNGVVIATACESLKLDKRSNEDLFDYYFREPRTCRPSVK